MFNLIENYRQDSAKKLNERGIYTQRCDQSAYERCTTNRMQFGQQQQQKRVKKNEEHGLHLATATASERNIV